MARWVGAGHSMDSPEGHFVLLEYNLHVMYRICIRCSNNFHPSALALYMYLLLWMGLTEDNEMIWDSGF